MVHGKSTFPNPAIYPRVKYHATKEPITVYNVEEESALDKTEWFDSPADVPGAAN